MALLNPHPSDVERIAKSRARNAQRGARDAAARGAIEAQAADDQSRVMSAYPAEYWGASEAFANRKNLLDAAEAVGAGGFANMPRPKPKTQGEALMQRIEAREQANRLLNPTMASAGLSGPNPLRDLLNRARAVSLGGSDVSPYL